jgi:RNA polymerase sigma-70 factor (ECF subfamily)
MADDITSLRQIVERHQGGLFALVRGLGLDGHTCEDVVQDAFLKAFQHADDFDPRRGSYRAWLYGIARNAALNVIRKKRPVSLPDPPERGEAPPPEEPVEFSRLDAALQALPLDQRAAFVLAEIHGLTHAEVAAIEGVAVGTVKSRTARARERLRAALRVVSEETT